MEQYQINFIEFLIKQQALLFGSFTLKSGRVSPYFFNAGQFNNTYALAKLGQFYATAIAQAQLSFDLLFGPAYKGIPILAGTGVALYEKYAMNIPFCFNRKEAKTHGEGGDLIGAPLQGRVLIVDDVISSGTTFKESANLIKSYGADLIGIVTAMDREEKGETALSAIEEIEQHYSVKVIKIIELRDVIEYMKAIPKFKQEVQAILAYQQEYGSERYHLETGTL